MSAIGNKYVADADQFGSISDRLNRFIQDQCGAQSRVLNFHPMEDGHAGLTFGFDVIEDGARPVVSYVLKIAPIGVSRRGNTDVYRQAPLLRSLRQAGLPVPAVPWASPSEDALGTPFIIMERLPGRIFFVWEPHDSFAREISALRAIWLQAAELLGELHRVDWRTMLADWEEPRSLCDELNRWMPLLRHAERPEIAEQGAKLHSLLTAGIPDANPIGVVHGDFHPGNILYVEGQATAVIDWELAFIGSQGLDVGWLMTTVDELAWPSSCRPLAPISRADLLDAYRRAGGATLDNIEWYQALANFRLGAIGCLNLKLHRSGKRPDRFWESFAPAIPMLFARGIELASVSNASDGTVK